MLIYLVAGARPNFMKIAPLWHELTRPEGEFEVRLVHTGQHYDYGMSQVFFDQLQLPEPHHFLNVGSGSHAYQTAQVMMMFEDLLREGPLPDMVIVVGDVNSTLAAALAARKLGVQVAHGEAGLRSNDRRMPEEVNRLATDAISDVFLVSEPSGAEHLRREGASEEKINLVGNLMIDTLAAHIAEIRRRPLELPDGVTSYGVVTVHRPSNVDTPAALNALVDILLEAASRSPLLWPVHPRTAKRLEEFGLEQRCAECVSLHRLETQGYFEFMRLVDSATFVLTDSGGIQEETTWLGVPCITLRENTERPLTIDQGTNTLTGVSPAAVRQALDAALVFDRAAYQPPALWDGNAAQRVSAVLKRC